MVQPISKPDTLAEVVEYRVSISGRGGGSGSRAVTVTFEGVDARRNLLPGKGEAEAEDTVREAVEHMLPSPWSVVRVSRTSRVAVTGHGGIS